MTTDENICPRVSVCIPTFNYGHFISDAIDSVLGQTFDDFDLTIIDNCSSDDTRLIVDEYVKRDSRVRYLCNESNVGFAKNLNRCLDASSGQYIKLLCSDDVLESDCLRKMVNILDKNPGVSLVTCARQLVDSNLEPISLLSYSDKSEIVSGQYAIKKCLIYGNLIGEPTAGLFRKKDAGRGFDLKYRQVIDLEMWFHLLEQGDFAYISEALCLFRQHEEQETKKNDKSAVHIDDLIELFFQYSRKPYSKLTYYQNLKARYNIAHIIWCFDIDITYKKEKISLLLGPQGLPTYHLLSFFKKIKKSYGSSKLAR